MSCQSSVLGALPAWIINDWPRLLPQQALGAGLGLPLGGLLPSGLEEAGCIASLLHPQGGRTKICLLCCHKFSLKEGEVWARGWVPRTRHGDRGQVIGCGTSAGEHMVPPRGRSRDPFPGVLWKAKIVTDSRGLSSWACPWDRGQWELPAARVFSCSISCWLEPNFSYLSGWHL